MGDVGNDSEVWNPAAIRKHKEMMGDRMMTVSTLKHARFLLFIAHTYKQAQTNSQACINRLRHIYSHKYPKVSKTLLISINNYYASQAAPKINLLAISLFLSFSICPAFLSLGSSLISFASCGVVTVHLCHLSLFPSLFSSLSRFLSLPPTSGPLQSKWSD